MPPLAVIHIVTCILNAVVVSVGIDKFGVDIFLPLIIFVQAALYFTCNHVQCRFVACNAVPLDIKIKLEGVASLLTFKFCQNVAELSQPSVAKFINNYFGHVVFNYSAINFSSRDKPFVGLVKIWNMSSRFFKFGLERHISADCYSARIVDAAVAPLLEDVVFARNSSERGDVALVVCANTSYCALIIRSVGCGVDGCIAEYDVIDIAASRLEVGFQFIGASGQINCCLASDDGVVVPFASVGHVNYASYVGVTFEYAKGSVVIARSDFGRPQHCLLFVNSNGVVEPLASG